MAKLSDTCRKQTHTLQIMVFKGIYNSGSFDETDESNFLCFSDFTDRYNIETNFLTFQGVISAVKALWKSNVENLHIGNAIHESITDTFLKMKKPNRLAYKILVSKKQETHHRPKEMDRGLHA